MSFRIIAEYILDGDPDSLLDISKAYKEAEDIRVSAAPVKHFREVRVTPIRDEPIENRGNMSDRESEVIKELSAGNSNKVIARNLGITEATVKVYMKSLFKKIGVTNRTQAALWAVKNS